MGMNFHDYLSELPLDDLKLIAATLEVRPAMISRARLVRELPIQMLQPGFIASLVEQMDQAQQDLLIAVMFAGDRGYPSDVAKASAGHLLQRLYELLSQGLIVGRRGTYQAPEYVIPSDIREILGRHFAHRLMDRLSADEPPAGGDESGSMSFIRDLFSFLTWLRSEPARLTDKDVIYKRALDHLLERLESNDDHTSSSPQPYPDRLDLMIQYSRSRRLIYEEDSRLRCSSAFEQWLHLPTTEKLDDLLAFWYSRNHSQSHCTASLLSLLGLCIDLEGIDRDALTDLAIICTPGQSRAASVQIHNRLSVQEALLELEWLGVVRHFGHRKGVPTSLVITPPGRSVLGNRPWVEEGTWAEAFLVQPTYEVIVPHTLQLAIRDELELFSDLIGADRTLTYRVTRETVYRAGDEGMSGAAIIAFLERRSEKQLPQNVEYSIREWAENYGQVYFMEVFLLRAEDPEIARHIKAHKQLAPFVLGEVGPDALIVERHRYREIMNILRSLDFMPRSQVVGMDAERSPIRHHFAREHYADVWARQHPHRAPHRAVGIDECLPGYRLTHQLQARDNDSRHLTQSATMQHLSPKRTQELLEMAITHENSVLIEYFVANRNHSKLQKIRPQRIDRSRGSPHVEAHSLWEDISRVFNIANIKAIRLTEDENTTR
ncbi:MAG: helicase-associated domain-containing protein [Gemmatimonadota bacterium]|nr:helicase-associated domain-containing protein [Gemmatimonadota bacterium]